MKIIDIDKHNIEKEHICCAISNIKNDVSVSSKKGWMTINFDNGLVFKRLDARGKVFIEYMPAEKAWVPVKADGYMFINCFWVSGQFKGKGYADKLLAECIKDAKPKGKKGLVINSADKKRPFLSDPEFLKHKGFKECDSAQPYFRLYYLPFKEREKVPHYTDAVKNQNIKDKGLVLYYSFQCPFVGKYSALMKEAAEKRGIRLKMNRFENYKEAQKAPSPFTAYALFYNGKLYSSEILSMPKFEKLLNEISK